MPRSGEEELRVRPVEAGRPYLVGERGRPELFVPNMSGTIKPVGSGTGGISVAVYQQIDLSSGITPTDAAYIRTALDQSKAETVQATINAIRSINRNDSKWMG